MDDADGIGLLGAAITLAIAMAIFLAGSSLPEWTLYPFMACLIWLAAFMVLCVVGTLMEWACPGSRAAALADKAVVGFMLISPGALLVLFVYGINLGHALPRGDVP